MLASDVNSILRITLGAINPFKLLTSVLSNPNGNSLCVQGTAYKLHSNVKVIGAGKAVGGMVRALQDIIGDHIIKGVVSLPLGYRETFYAKKDLYPLYSSVVDVYEGGKDNLPDEHSLLASRAIYQLAKEAEINELVIVLLTGGASALTSLPPDSISIDQKRAVCSSLSQRGASINELNTVRKHLSLLKGGKLAALCRPAEVLTFILSDVIDDPLDTIASGPCYPDSSTKEDFLSILHRYQIFDLLPESLVETILQLCSDEGNSHLPASICPVIPQHVVIGNNKLALEAAGKCAVDLGYNASVWSDRIGGNIVAVSSFYSAVILSTVIDIYLEEGACKLREELIERCLSVLGMPSIKDNDTLRVLYKSYIQAVTDFGDSKKVCLLSGGEPVVLVTGNGVGGRNQELALRVGVNLELVYNNMSFILNEIVPCGKFQTFWDSISITFASIGTDGQDGPTPVAGAMTSQHFMRDNDQHRHAIYSSLLRNDSYNVFMRLGAERHLIRTGLTGTNVMDIHLMLITC